MAKCAAITRVGTACKGTPIDDSGYCYVHHPDKVEERKRLGSRGGRRGGRGRPSAELHRLQKRFEELAESVLEGETNAKAASVAGYLLNCARACIRDALTAREQEELIERLEQLEEALEHQKGGYHYGT
jgi:hypothetical protein